MFVWDEAKRKSNLEKHGLDFKDARLVYDSPDKCTYEAGYRGERRLMDLATTVVRGRLLALIYTERGDDVSVISFRPASREERDSMNKTKTETDWKRVQAFKEGDRIPYELEDGPYDPNDAEAPKAWFAQADLIRKGKVVRRGKRGPQKAPTKKLVSLRLSAEVVEHFKASGPGWQTRIDNTLAEAIKRRA